MNTITKLIDLKRSLSLPRRWWLMIGGVGVFLTIILMLGLYLFIVPNLPSVDVLKDVRFQVPLQVYSQDNQLIAEYGSKKRDPLRYEQIPATMIPVWSLSTLEDTAGSTATTTLISGGTSSLDT